MNRLSYSITYEPQFPLVRLCITGSVSPEKLGKLCSKGINEGRKYGCSFFLVDYSEAEYINSTAGTYNFMSSLENIGVSRFDKIAVIYVKNKNEHRFAETVAQNRGWHNVNYFSSVKEGERWLKGNLAGISTGK